MIIFENSIKNRIKIIGIELNLQPFGESQDLLSFSIFFFFFFFFSRYTTGKLERSWERAADAAGNKYSWNRIDHRAGDRRKNHPSSNFTIRHQIDSHEVFDEMTNNGETEDENHRWMIAHVRIPDENWTSIWDQCVCASVCTCARARVYYIYIYVYIHIPCWRVMLVCELVSWCLISWSCSFFFHIE